MDVCRQRLHQYLLVFSLIVVYRGGVSSMQRCLCMSKVHPIPEDFNYGSIYLNRCVGLSDVEPATLI